MNALRTRLLLLEDDPIVARVVRTRLKNQPELEIHHVTQLAAAVEYLANHEVDIALIDLGLPDSEGLDTLRAVTKAAPYAPVVVLTGQDDEATGQTAVREGAQDYLVKGNAPEDALARVLRYALERGRIQARLYHTNQILRSVRNVSKLVIRAKDAQVLLDEACTLLVETRGYHAAWIGLAREQGRYAASAGTGTESFEPFARWLTTDDWPAASDLATQSPHGVVVFDSQATKADCWPASEYGQGATAIALLRHEEQSLGLLGVIAPKGFTVDEQERSLLGEVADDLAYALSGIERDRRARLNEQHYRASFETPGFGQALTSREGGILKANHTLAKMLGYRAEELEGRPLSEIAHPEDLPTSWDAMRALLAGQETQRFERRYLHKTGSVIWADVNLALVRDSSGVPEYFIACFVDVTDRKQAEELLRRQKEFSELLVQSSVDGILAFDRECRYTLWNSGMEALSGVRREEVLGRVAFEVFPFLRDTGEGELFRAALAGESVAVHNRPYAILATGRHGHFEGHYAPLRAESGEVIGGLATIRDVSERQRADQVLRRSLDETHALLEASRAVLTAQEFRQAARAALDAARRVTGAAAGYIAVTTRERAEAETVVLEMGEGWSTADSCLPGPLRELNARVLRTGEVIVDNRFAESSWAARLPQGLTAPRNLLFAPLAMDIEVAGLMALGDKPTDFSDRDVLLARAFAEFVTVSLRNTRQLESIQRSEEQYRSLVENLSDVVFTIDVEGRVTYTSGAVTRYGFAPDELLGRSFGDFIHPEDLPAVEGSVAKALAGLVTPVEFRLLDRAGKVHFVRSSSRPVQEAGHTVGLTGVLIDFTEQREIEQQLRVVQKMEAVGRLAGGIAHDFNNVLSVILNYARFAFEATREGDPLRDDLEQIRKATQRAAALTRQLLAFSRRQVLQPEVLDLDAVVEDMEKMLRRLIGEDIELTFLPARGLWATQADRGQIEQVIMNLAVNSRDAMPEGGRLTIETCNSKLDETFVTRHLGAKPGLYATLTITDTGHGMDSTTLARLFEPFFTTKARGKGTGLGLATVYGIVKQTGGSIWVQSQVGKGTAVTVYLPRVEATAGLAARPSATPRLCTGSETILVVEDEEAVRELSRRILTAAGYQVHTAANAGEALLLCEKLGEAVHLLLTDVVMPGMSGRELAVRLVELSPRMKVLYMSGYTDGVIVQEGVLETGINFISKPFTMEELTTRVREVLDGTAFVKSGRLGEPLAAQPRDGAPAERAGSQLLELPGGLREELRKAVLAARYDQILALVDRIEDVSPDSATEVRERLHRFDYDGILALVKVEPQ
jgi:two-component system cell cycle sensor histidine kinase/response regulator CckA